MTGARILIAEDEAVVAEHQPDLVIMDIRLEGEMDGIEAAALIRERFQTPVIYLSAYGYGETLDRAKETEPYAFINKPFDERELIVNIHTALYRYHAGRELDLLSQQLQTALKQIATLRQLIPMCGTCKRVRVDEGYWQELEVFLAERAGIRLTHGYCPACSDRILKEFENDFHPPGARMSINPADDPKPFEPGRVVPDQPNTLN